MSNVLLRAFLSKVSVNKNGDTTGSTIKPIDEEIEDISNDLGSADDKKKEKLERKLEQLKEKRENILKNKDNKIVITLEYPRSGTNEVITIKEVFLDSGNYESTKWDTSDFFSSGLLKEVIQGETTMTVTIIDSDKKSGIGQFLSTLFHGVLNTLTGGAIEKLSNVVISSLAGSVNGQIQEALKNTKEKNQVIAKSEKVKMSVEGGELKILNLGDPKIHFSNNELILDLTAPQLIRHSKNNTPVVYLKEDEANGVVAIHFTVTPL